MSEHAKDAVRRLFRNELAEEFQVKAGHKYHNAAGRLLYVKVRLKHPDGRKNIRPIHLNGDGSWHIGEGVSTGPKVLYRLGDLVEQPGADAWVTEGEQKADEIVKFGMLATTSGGATSAAAFDWKPLAGRTVTIWPDNDVPGQAYASEVAAILREHGCTVRVLDVAALGLPPKGDAVDWLAAHPGATADDVRALPLVPAAAQTEGPAEQGAWPDPKPLVVKVEPEPYPLDALPSTIRTAVEEVAAFVKAPIPMVASSALGALSLACQAHVDVKRAEKLQGPVSLDLLTIADSGERKTTVDGFFTTAIRDHEAQQAEAAKPEIERYAAAKAAWDAEREGLLSAIKSASAKGKLVGRLRADLEKLQRAQSAEPRVPRLLLGDETPEHLAWRLAKEWPSAGVVSNEAGAIFGSHGMGRDNIMRNLALLNVMWDGGTHSVGRRTSESFTVKGARLTVSLQVQEATLREFFERAGVLARGTGFLARFLVAWPESTQGWRPFAEPPSGWPRLAAFHRRIAAILADPVPIEGDGSLSPLMLSLSPEAKAA